MLKKHSLFSLKQLNTFGIEAHALGYQQVKSSSEAFSYLEQISRSKEVVFILGGGSNILFVNNLNAFVLHNKIEGVDILDEDEINVHIRAGAGVNWHELVLYTLSKGWGGLENLSYIPGNTGAGPMQNIGAYGVEIKDVCTGVSALNIMNGNTVYFSREACRFGYRESIFKQEEKGRYLITHVDFKLSKKNHTLNTHYGAIEEELKSMGIEHPQPIHISKAVTNIRKSKLPNPAEIGNAGSFFKNPVIQSDQAEQLKKDYPNLVSYPAGNGFVKLAAGWLIEYAGWKGFREGDAGVHALQALVLVNYGNASGKDIFDLSQRVLDSVYAKYGVMLEREVNIV